MPRETKASKLASKVLEAKGAWEDAMLHREQADTEYEYAEKRLVLARQELALERGRMAPDDDWEHEVTQGFGYPEEVLAELGSVEFVGKSIGAASHSSLLRLKRATAAHLASHMRGKGFRFATDVHAREVHGALVKQTWAGKDTKTNEWVYLTADA